MAQVHIEGVRLPRTLWLVTHPLRTLSQAGQKFMQEVFAIDTADRGDGDGAPDAAGGGADGQGVGAQGLPKVMPLRSSQTMPWEGV